MSVEVNNTRAKLKAVSKSARWPFLVLTPACLFLGWSVAIVGQTRIEIHLLILSFLGAVLAHVSVNTLNEYLDFKSGLDLKTIKTGFSGGSGALPENPEMARVVLITGIASLILTLMVGFFFVWKYDWKIIPIGIAGLLLIVTYTRWINKHPLLCLLAPGAGFGFLMVAGAYFSLTGEYSVSLWIISLVPFFLVNNLLLLNQYPDIDADRDVGRRNFPVVYGTRVSNIMYFMFITMAGAVIVASVATGILPALGLAALLPLPLAFFSLHGAIKYGDALGEHPGYLGANVVVAILSPVLLGVSIITG